MTCISLYTGSVIWQYRTRTGPFKQGAGDSPSVSTQALAEGVRKCNDAIMMTADVQVCIICLLLHDRS